MLRGAAAHYRYSPYGVRSVVAGVETDASASDVGYTGGIELSEDIVHLGARDLWPMTGRFLQADDLDPRRYTYGSNDPLNRIDPSGHPDGFTDDGVRRHDN